MFLLYLPHANGDQSPYLQRAPLCVELACWCICRSYLALPQKAYFWQAVVEVPLDVKYNIMSVDANSHTGT